MAYTAPSVRPLMICWMKTSTPSRVAPRGRPKGNTGHRAKEKAGDAGLLTPSPGLAPGEPSGASFLRRFHPRLGGVARGLARIARRLGRGVHGGLRRVAGRGDRAAQHCEEVAVADRLAGFHDRERLELAALHREDRDLGVLAVALFVERDRPGRAAIVDLRQLGQILRGIRGVRFLHRLDEQVRTVVSERRIEDRILIEFRLVGVEELLARRLRRNAGLRAEQSLGCCLAGELAHLVGAGAVAESKYRLEA